MLFFSYGHAISILHFLRQDAYSMTVGEIQNFDIYFLGVPQFANNCNQKLGISPT